MTWRRRGIYGLVTGAAAVAVLGGSALAGAYVHGTICQADTGAAGYDVLINGVVNRSSTSALSVLCPSPIDHDVGASLQSDS